MASLQQLQQTVKDLKGLLGSGDGLMDKALGGGRSAAATAGLQADLANAQGLLSRSPGGPAAIRKMQEEDRQQQGADRLSGIKGLGASLGPKGLFAPGGKGVSPEGIGGAVAGVGGVIPGPVGEGFKIAGAIIQVAGKIDAWAKAQLNSNFAYAAASPAMSAVQAKFETSEVSRDREMGERTAASAAELANMRSQSAGGWQDTKVASQLVLNKAATWWETMSLGASEVLKGNMFGEREKEIAEERWQEILKTEAVNLTEWALDSEWVQMFGTPQDFNGM